jgi:hypothetical protein
MPPPLTRTYPYNGSPTRLAGATLFFIACATFFGYRARVNDRGLILNGILTFSPSGATLFYWVLTAMSVGMVIAGFLALIGQSLGSATLEITESTIRIPRGLLKTKVHEVQFAEVRDLSEVEIHGRGFFYLHTCQGKYYVNSTLLPSKEAYEEVKRLISRAVAAAHAADAEQGRGLDGPGDSSR